MAAYAPNEVPGPLPPTCGSRCRLPASGRRCGAIGRCRLAASSDPDRRAPSAYLDCRRGVMNGFSTENGGHVRIEVCPVGEIGTPADLVVHVQLVPGDEHDDGAIHWLALANGERVDEGREGILPLRERLDGLVRGRGRRGRR